MEQPRISSRVLAVAGLGWLLLAVFSSSGTYWSFQGQGLDVPWPRIFAVSVLGTLPWLAATPLVLWLGGRFPIHGDRWVRSMAAHLPASLAVLAVASVLAEAGRAWLLGEPFDGLVGRALAPTRGWLWIDWLLYWAVLGIGAAWRLAHAASTRREEAARLEAQNALLRSELSEAHLDNLRARLEPHFLFNALNSLQGLVRRGHTETASVMISRLGELLRGALTSDRRPFIPLDEELDHARAYLELEGLRIGKRMSWSVEAEGPIDEVRVPPLLIQPLIENAVRHGVAEIGGEGAVRVRVSVDPSEIRVRVENDGPLRDGNGSEDQSAMLARSGDGAGRTRPTSGQDRGYGLSLTRERLARAYGGRAALTLGERAEGGMIAAIHIPRGDGEE